MVDEIKDRILAPYYDNSKKRWVIRYWLGGTRKSKSFKAKVDAYRFHTQLLNPDKKYKKKVAPSTTRKVKQKTKAPTNFLHDLPPYKKASSSFFRTALGHAIQAAHAAAVAGDLASLAVIEKYAKILTTNSNAALPHKRIEELEDQLEKANNLIREMRRQRVEENATQSEQGGPTNEGVMRTAKSGKSLL